MGLRRKIKKDEFIKVGTIGYVKSLRQTAHVELSFPKDTKLTHIGVDGRPILRKTKPKR